MLSRPAAAISCAKDPTAHFGGPDKAPGLLRDMLMARIAETPRGGAIHWATYYFNDLELAQALIDASDRGVSVRLVMEGAPHHPCVNRPVIGLLRAHGLGEGLRVLHHGLPVGHPLHLHAKVYAFDHAFGSALLGSYNPLNGAGAGGLQSLGDHDRGHNFLVEAFDAPLVEAVARYVERLSGFRSWAGLRADPQQNQPHTAGDIELHTFPRREVAVLEARLDWLCAGDSVRGCVSHIDDGPATAALAAAAQRGVLVDLHLGPTGRRVSLTALHRLHRSGARLSLYRGPSYCPMHCKFLVLNKAHEREVLFGSFNLNTASRWLNHELLARSGAPTLVEAFERRFQQLSKWAEPAFEEMRR